jgi:hypothetical protein
LANKVYCFKFSYGSFLCIILCHLSLTRSLWAINLYLSFSYVFGSWRNIIFNEKRVSPNDSKIWSYKTQIACLAYYCVLSIFERHYRNSFSCNKCNFNKKLSKDFILPIHSHRRWIILKKSKPFFKAYKETHSLKFALQFNLFLFKNIL